MISVIAGAVSLALQVETGPVIMAPPSDDTYVERAMPGKTTESYNTLAFGLGVKLATGPLRLQLGWRNLGDQHSSGPIIDDETYFHIRDARGVFPAATQFWHSEGNEQQAFAELGYAVSFDGGLRIVPSIGMAENRITWHYTIQYLDHPEYNSDSWTVKGGCARTQMHPAPFAGLTFERGKVGVGFYYLVTDPMRSLVIDPSYPGQGRYATYVRLTYSIGGN